MTRLPKKSGVNLPISPLAKRLREAGLRLTPQRLAIFQALKESHSHPTADELYQEVRRRFPMVSRNTIYLTLEALKRVGETAEVQVGREAARFELNPMAHDHAVCLRCKTITDISDRALRRLKPPPGLRARFHVISHRVDFFGLCEACTALRRCGDRNSGRGPRNSEGGHGVDWRD